MPRATKKYTGKWLKELFFASLYGLFNIKKESIRIGIFHVGLNPPKGS
jgi:hypothetical protein